MRRMDNTGVRVRRGGLPASTGIRACGGFWRCGRGGVGSAGRGEHFHLAKTASDQPGGPPRRIKVYGSGFIIDPSGIIVTNKHVIDGAFDIKATLSDGTLVSASLLAASAPGRYRGAEGECRPHAAPPRVGQQRRFANRRSGADDRERVRLGNVGFRRDSQWAEPQPDGFAVRQLHPDRRVDQPWQLRRPADQSGRKSGWH